MCLLAISSQQGWNVKMNPSIEETHPLIQINRTSRLQQFLVRFSISRRTSTNIQRLRNPKGQLGYRRFHLCQRFRLHLSKRRSLLLVLLRELRAFHKLSASLKCVHGIDHRTVRHTRRMSCHFLTLSIKIRRTPSSPSQTTNPSSSLGTLAQLAVTSTMVQRAGLV